MLVSLLTHQKKGGMRISPAGVPLGARDVEIDAALIRSSSALEITRRTDGRVSGRQSDSTYDSAALPVSCFVCADLVSTRLGRSVGRSVAASLCPFAALSAEPPASFLPCVHLKLGYFFFLLFFPPPFFLFSQSLSFTRPLAVCLKPRLMPLLISFLPVEPSASEVPPHKLLLISERSLVAG